MVSFSIYHVVHCSTLFDCVYSLKQIEKLSFRVELNNPGARFCSYRDTVDNTLSKCERNSPALKQDLKLYTLRTLINCFEGYRISKTGRVTTFVGKAFHPFPGVRFKIFRGLPLVSSRFVAGLEFVGNAL